MANTLSNRLDWLERKLPKPRREGGRFIRLVTSDEEQDEAYKLALEQGFDPSDDSDDILIIRIAALSPNSERRSEPPRVL